MKSAPLGVLAFLLLLSVNQFNPSHFLSAVLDSLVTVE